MHESRYAGGLLVARDQEQVCSFLREPWICAAVCGLLVSDRWHHTFTSEMRVNMEFGQMEKRAKLIVQKNKVTNRKVADTNRKWTT